MEIEFKSFVDSLNAFHLFVSTITINLETVSASFGFRSQTRSCSLLLTVASGSTDIRFLSLSYVSPHPLALLSNITTFYKVEY